jgi:transposase-like protein
MLGRFMGIPRHTMALHLKECEFRWNHKDEKEMITILKKICF